MFALLGLTTVAAACQEPALPPCGTPAAECPQPSTERFVDPLVHVGRAQGPTFIEIVDVVADGDLVYACTGTKGLTIWDASGDGAPRLLSDETAPKYDDLANTRFPRCQHVALDPSNNRLVITNRGDEIQPTPWIWAYDVTDPTRPDDLGGWTTFDSVEGVAIRDGLIFAAMHTAGVTLMRLTDAGGFDRLSTHSDEMSDAWVPVALDDRLYVAEGATGLRIYDIATDEVALLGTLPLEGSSRDVVVEGDRAYVANSGGLAVVDISDPAAPMLLSQTDSAGTTLGLALGADSTVLMAEWDQVRAYDVSDPTAVRPIFAEVVPSDDDFSRVLGIDVDPARRRVYAGEWRGLQVFDHVGGGRGPDISVSPGVLQFGQLANGDEDTRVVVVRNHGDLPLTVHDLVGGPGVTTDTECFQVPAGGATAVEVSLRVPDTAPVDTALKVCSDDLDEGEHLIDISANVPGLSVGDMAPNIMLNDLDGNVWTTEQLRGNIAVLAYFATF